MTELGEGWETALRALHGDLRPLVALLRSDQPFGRAVRDYLADEIEREPGKRFRRRRKTDLSAVQRDLTLLLDVSTAKMELAIRDHGEAALHHLGEITDSAALDRLSETGRSNGATEDALKNARRRLPKV